MLYRSRSNDPLPHLATALGIHMSNHDISPKVKYGEHDCLKKNTLQEYSNLYGPQATPIKKQKKSPNRTKNNKPTKPTINIPSEPSNKIRKKIPKKSHQTRKSSRRRLFHALRVGGPRTPMKLSFLLFGLRTFLRKLDGTPFVSYSFRQLYPQKPATIALKIGHLAFQLDGFLVYRPFFEKWFAAKFGVKVGPNLVGSWTQPILKNMFAQVVKNGVNKIFPNFRGENKKNVWVATTQFQFVTRADQNWTPEGVDIPQQDWCLRGLSPP